MAARDDSRAAEREPLISSSSDPARLQKEASIRRKLRTYEAILALRAGYMPSTDQLLQWARYAMRNSGVLDSRNRGLSPPGRQFVRDLRAWIEAVADLAEQKNGDDKVQDFLYHTSRAQVSARLPSIGTSAAASTTDVHQLYSRLRLLFGLLYSSPEFRKLAHDFTVIARDMFADAASLTASYASRAAEKAQSAAAQARPSEDELAHVDDPAGAALPTKEQGDAAAPGRAGAGRTPSKAELRRQTVEKSRTYAEETRRKAYAAGSEIEDYLKHKFPKQRRDAVINRLKKVVADIQSKPDFQETFEFIGSLMSDYITHIKDTILQEGKKAKKDAQLQYDEHFTMALQRGREIIQAFAGGKSLDPIRDTLADVIRDVENDPDLSAFWEDVADLFKKMVREPGFAATDEADAEAHELFDRSKHLLEIKTDTYNWHVGKLFNEVGAFTTAIQNDKANRRVVAASQKVWSDAVVVDSRHGGVRFRTKLARDMRDVMLPKLIEEIKYIPLPRIEYQDRDYDVILENVVLESDQFLPHRLLFEAHTRAEYISTQTQAFTRSYSGATTRLSLYQLSLTLRDTSFVVRKKTGLIPFSDRGFFDIDLTLSCDIVLDKVTDDYDDDDTPPDEWFRVRSVDVRVERFAYRYNAYHSWAAKLCAPIVKPMVRRLVERVAGEKIREALEAVDREGHALVERVRVATIANKGGGSLEAWIQAVVSRPKGVFGGRGGGRGKVAVQGGERGVRLQSAGRRRGEGFVVTIGAQEELFPGEHGPGAVLAKAGAAADRVAEGERIGWGNAIFDVGA
ncbi:hypothetical protein EV426DRAFT_636185 [Tirmania nivea]|nr:hypothetical protein EV426DRAFT_636185 [Tirmania nivea]